MRFLFILLLTLAACDSFQKTKVDSMPKSNTKSVVEINGALAVKGNKIINAKDKVVSFAGSSFFWSNNYYNANHFYNKEVVKWLKDDWNASIIRVPLAADPTVMDSHLYDLESNIENIEKVIDAAIALGLYVIIDWHSQHAEDHETEAIAFFQKMATKYGKYPNVIYEIYNEPLKIDWDTVLKPYAENVIAEIRKIDPDNLIIVGTPHWSQDVDIASENPIIGYDNIAYTLHFYAGSHKEWLLNKAKKALDNGIALMVTEWGTVNADGNGAVDPEYVKKWMDFMKEHQLTHCNWSVHDKDEGASIVKKGTNPKGNWTDDDLTESGKLVKSYMVNWKND